MENMLKIGIVGFGFMGRMHLSAWKTLANAEVVALCDARSPEALFKGDAGGNIEGAASGQEGASLPCYPDLKSMLANETLDAISITLPTYLHADTSIQALQAGVHVLCEKPMALTLADCDRMIAAAEASDRILQIGHCIRFWPEYMLARQMVQDGRYGALRAATLRRLGSRPDWSQDQWLLNTQRSGGMALDLHIHDTDYVLHLLGTPKAVRSFTAPPDDAFIVTHYLYDQAVVTAEGSWAMTCSFGFLMAFTLVLERATLVYDCTRSPALQIHPADGETQVPEVPEGDGYLHEIAHFVQRIQGEHPESIITLEDSREAIRIVQAEIESVAQARDIIL
jgi:predicted dehydrogenase